MLEAFRALCIRIFVSSKSTLKEERGDTNFISILIILAIVVVLAGLFIGFKDDIVDQVKAIVEGFTISK